MSCWLGVTESCVVYSNCCLVSRAVANQGRRGRSTYNVRHGLFSVNVLFHDTILVNADRGEDIERILVAWVDTVENQSDDDLLPCRAALVPEFRLLQIDNVADVLHDTVQRPRSQRLIFVVVGNGNQQLRVPIVHGRPQVVTVMQRELVRVAGRSGVWQKRLRQCSASGICFEIERTSHVRELLAAALEIIAVLCLNRILNGTGHGVVDTQD